MADATATAVKRVEEAPKLVEPPSLFDQLEDTFKAITRRAYELFESNGHEFGRDLENWFQAEKELLHPVPVNITEADAFLEVKAEVPGFTEKEIEISVEPRRLTIAGKKETKKEEKKGTMIYAESAADHMFRTFTLPVEVETEKATATLKNGVLNVILPKIGKTRTVRVHPKPTA